MPNNLIVLAMIFLEWLDFTLYIYLAKAVFSVQFFPHSNHSLMLTFALFAVAYLARPLGGWLFGQRADLKGRRNPMVFSAALMGIATLGICLLPGYDAWGYAATWSLLLLRFAQGLALGGEINTSGMFLIEHAPKQPVLAGSYVAASGALGMFAGGMLSALIQNIANASAWRVVFATVGIFSLGVCRLRKQLTESPEFAPKPPMPFSTFWQHHKPGLINIAILGAFVSVTVYLCNAYWIAFASSYHLWSNTQCAWIGALCQCASAALAIPIARRATERACEHLLKSSMLLIAMVAPALFYATATGHFFWVVLALAGYVLTNALICSSLFYFLYRQLPAQYRCRGVSTLWALAASLGAVFLPLAEYIVSHYNAYWFPGLLVSLTALSAWQMIRSHTSNIELTPQLTSV